MTYPATLDENKSRVRVIKIYRADENGIIFHALSFKDLYKQLHRNPYIEMCFVDSKGKTQVRVNGKAEPIESQMLKEEMVEKRSFLKPWIQEKGWNLLKVFKITNAKATVWTIETNFQPKKYIKL
ncbi:MAG: pyridoxamine 5'-phosphate oxidase family protein [Methanothermobacter sp.]|nr:pyridoxamine 5'-phosphate oxidase family protein [Methanothermobacter sp.]